MNAIVLAAIAVVLILLVFWEQIRYRVRNMREPITAGRIGTSCCTRRVIPEARVGEYNPFRAPYSDYSCELADATIIEDNTKVIPGTTEAMQGSNAMSERMQGVPASYDGERPSAGDTATDAAFDWFSIADHAPME